ncbi:MAG: hypothetical protein H2057_02955 [Alphaproteobacteria bacterium]|nr:hypothetical protein [Alphaproteobacteria bacterium]
METQLILSRGGFPPYSARGCQQTLTPLKTGEFRRTVNGMLVFTGSEKHRKYQSVLSCRDAAPPSFEGLWQGETVEVSCLQRLVQEVTLTSKTLQIVLDRPAVKGSVTLQVRGEPLLPMLEAQGSEVSITERVYEGQKGYLSYRPILTMRVISFHLETDEWGAEVGWTLTLEEI